MGNNWYPAGCSDIEKTVSERKANGGTVDTYTSRGLLFGFDKELDMDANFCEGQYELLLLKGWPGTGMMIEY